jgi:hypothetical protein
MKASSFPQTVFIADLRKLRRCPVLENASRFPLSYSSGDDRFSAHEAVTKPDVVL